MRIDKFLKTRPKFIQCEAEHKNLHIVVSVIVCLHLIILYILSIESIRRTEVDISRITSTECYSWHYVNGRARRCFSYTSHVDIISEIFKSCSRWIIYQEGVKNTTQFIGWFLCTIKLPWKSCIRSWAGNYWRTRQLCRI